LREVWARIEAVLRATAPDLLAALPAGATPEAIRAAETRLGATLPPDVCESYAVRNGSGEIGIVPCEPDYGVMGIPLHSLDEMVREWEMWQEWGQKRHGDGPALRPDPPPVGPIKADRYNTGWIPVAWDGGGGNLCIDLDPAPGGTPGQMIYLDHLNPQCVAAEGWRAFLERYAAALESGRLRFEAGELVVAR
jgi:cell wall assembly regulator SMI1